MQNKTQAAAAAREAALQKVIEVFRKHLPPGFSYEMGKYGHAFVVPLSTYPSGYHCNPSQALPFINFMNQSSHLAIYHMGLYAAKAESDWFIENFIAHTGKKPDMGKSCIRFKDPENIPYDLLAALAGRFTPEQWISCYESAFLSKKKK
jgi:hypothetical protein